MSDEKTVNLLTSPEDEVKDFIERLPWKAQQSALIILRHRASLHRRDKQLVKDHIDRINKILNRLRPDYAKK